MISGISGKLIRFILLLSATALLSGSDPALRSARPASAPPGDWPAHADASSALPAARLASEPVRAIYVTSHVAGSHRMDKLIRLVDETELNAMVIDVNSGIPLLSTSPRRAAASGDFRRLVKRLKQHRVYLIARVVTFKNPQLAQAHPAWAIQRANGAGVWRDRKGAAWIDPFRQETWEHPIALAVEAARLGFDEVQFDYVRFPENKARLDREARFRNPNGWSRNEAIRRFLHTATARVHRAGAAVSADVFGMVGSSRTDMGIGQAWPSIASEVDVISPMVYPSHYASGIWGIRAPDLKPGTVVSHALKDALRQNQELRHAGRSAARVRPWLQSFTASWVHPHQPYGPAQIREQIQAASRLGIRSYMLWNSTSRYPLG